MDKSGVKGEDPQAALEEDDQEGAFEIWKVQIQTVGEIVQDESRRGAGRGSHMVRHFDPLLLI